MDGVTVHERLAGHPGVAEILLDRAEALNAIDTAMALPPGAGLRRTGRRPAGPRDRAVRDRRSAPSASAPTSRNATVCPTPTCCGSARCSGPRSAGCWPCPQPVIAAVHGYALGGGCELALCCDVIVADETAVFGLPETTVGLVPGGGGTQLAHARLGPGKAADLIFTGRQVDAAEAGADRARRPDRAGGNGQPGGDRAGGTDGGQLAGRRQGGENAIRQGGTPACPRRWKWRTRRGASRAVRDRREGIAAFVEKRAADSGRGSESAMSDHAFPHLPAGGGAAGTGCRTRTRCPRRRRSR